MDFQWWGVGLILLIVYIPATNGLNNENAAGSGIQYSREFLLQCNSNTNAMDIPMAHLIPDCLRVDYKPKCKRGKRGGIRQRLKKIKNKLPLPTTLLINAQSLRGKADELSANLRFQHEYREACLLAFTETWLDDRVPDREVEPAGFTLVRADRDLTVTGKLHGGGVCLLVRDQWCKSILLFAISFSWAFHEVPPPKYQHYDPLTSELLLCDQCPPGTAVLTHCTADTPTACSPCPDRSFSEHWQWGDSCQYCTTVCKERQLVSQECNSTHDQLCECIPGYHLVVEFCIKHTSCPPGLGVTALGTPEIDTVCEACPQGLFSSRMSASEPCVPHRNCSELGLKTLRPGTPTQDTLCENEAKGSVLECSRHHTQCHTDVSLCEEAIFQSLASLRLSSVPLERLLESLPGKRVDRKSLERLKKACSPQQQILLLLRLWREHNKDQVKLYGIIQGVNHCERKVSRCASLKNLTLGDLLMVMKSLPGVRAHEEDIRAVVSSCRSQQYLLQLLHLWKNQNKDLDINKGLAHSLSRLRQQGAPRPLLRTIKKINRIISTSSIHKMYEKMFLNMIEDGTCFNTKPYNQ